ncbi:MAG: hypothetical protein WC073_10930 [Sterolibacterium sp.]|jgi:hypothetical protein
MRNTFALCKNAGMQLSGVAVMKKTDFDVLSSRLDGIARTLLIVISELELRGAIDGPSFSSRLTRYGKDRAMHPGLEMSGVLIQEMAQELNEARKNRRSKARLG